MIHLDQISFQYAGPGTEALSGLDLDLPAGGITLISGATGCGKTTLGLMLAGAIPHLIPGRLTGKISVNGLDPTTRPVRETARKVGLLTQNVELQIFTDRVEDEIAFGLENFGLPAQLMPGLVDGALDDLKVGHLRDRSLPTLSAGECQRVMIAALLCLGQPMLILDEPLAFLDRTSSLNLLSLLAELAGAGRTVLLFEHRRDLVMALAESELCLKDGRLVECPACLNEFPRIEKTSPSGLPCLIFDRASFQYEGAGEPLFQDVSLDVRSGESVVLLGENGSGKTTLLKLAMGLLRPTAGRIVNSGLKVGEASPRVLSRRAAYIFQNPDHQLYLSTVEEEVAWQAESPGRAVLEIKALGLLGLEKRHPRSLSMGQKRRLTLAAALARGPGLLLLDEPSVGQDDLSLALIFKRLEKFCADGGAVLSASHDIRACRTLAHRVIVLDNQTVRSGSGDLVEDFFHIGPRRTDVSADRAGSSGK